MLNVPIVQAEVNENTPSLPRSRNSTRSLPQLQDLREVSCIAAGGFGIVKQVEDEASHLMYALKQVSKCDFGSSIRTLSIA